MPAQWLALAVLVALLTGFACDNGGGSSGVRAPAGGPSAGELTIQSTDPADGATGVTSTAQIRVAFSAALDRSTVDSSSFVVTGSTSGPIAGVFAFENDDRTALFSPDAPYAYAETVGVTITTGVASAEGGQLGEDFAFSFTVEDDPNPPPPTLEVLGSLPVDGATGVSNVAQIQVVFSEALDTSTVDENSFQVMGSTSGPVQGAYGFADNDRTALFSPDGLYAYGETIQVLLTAAVTSAAGGQLDGDVSFSFAIEEDPNGPGPGTVTIAEVETTVPEAYAQGVDPDQVISVLFSHDLDAATTGPDTVWLSSPLTGRIGANVALSQDSRRLDLTPERAFHAGELVTVHLGSGIDPTGDEIVFHGETFSFRARSEALDIETTRVGVTSVEGNVRGMVAADLNLDGALDLVYRVENGTSIYFLLGDGQGGLASAAPVDLAQIVLAMAAADVDRDGDLDIVAGMADRTRLLLNEAAQDPPPPGDLRITPGPEVLTGTPVHGIAIGDLDHDAGLDYVLDTDSGLQVFLGSLTAEPEQVLGDSRLAMSEPVLADLDLDGQLDLVYGAGESPAVVYHLGQLPGTGAGDIEPPLFGEPHTVALTNEAWQVAVDSIEPGGLPEMVVLTTGGASRQGQSMRLVVSDGQGGYSAEPFTGGDEQPGDGEPAGEDMMDMGQFDIADLEGDARPDVVLTIAALNKVVLFRNREGEALPTAGSDLLSAPIPWSVTTADLTGDGIEEVIVSAMNEIHVVLPEEEEPPPPPPDTFELTLVGSEARQGDSGVSALIRLTNTAPLEGYELYVSYDPAALTPTDTNTDGTVLATDPPEFVSFQVREESSTIAISALMEFEFPFEGRTLPAQDDEPLIRILFDIPEAAPLGETPLDFQTETIFVSGGASHPPETTGGSMTILLKEEPPPPPTGNWKRIVDTSIDAGQEGLVEIRGGAEEKIDAFTTIVGFDSDVFEIMGIELEGSATAQFDPELEVADLEPEEGYFAYTVIFDFLAPFERQGIPAGQDFLLFNARFRVRSGTEDGSYPLTFRNEVGSPALFNIYAFGGRSIFPQLIGGEVRVRGSDEILFLRGDANNSRHLDISDAILVVTHLFRGGAAPPCRDAADTDDDGNLGLSDPVFLLLYIFKAGETPPAPFPEPGTDPTADDLDCLEGI